jgi:hypothetical protein
MNHEYGPLRLAAIQVYPRVDPAPLDPALWQLRDRVIG